MKFFFRQNESLLKATRGERSEAIEHLITSTSMRGGYYLMLMLSVLIVTPGLLLNNTPVVIGGMILAPLLAPILLLSLSLVTRSAKGMFHSLGVLFVSIATILCTAYGITWLIRHAEVNVRWAPDLSSPSLYVLIAVCSGIAAAFAWVKKDMAPTIAGVAIAVSLLPPICAAGIGMALLQRELATTAAIIFIANVAGIITGAVLVFMLMGFLPARTEQERAIENSQS